MALLELKETPPAYYQPYYAGWNAKDEGTAPYAGIHHPGGSVKRVNTTKLVESATYPGMDFIKNGHWHVKEWTSGSTAGGSSGSGLFDSNNQLIGGLSGGESSCPAPYNDFYFALSQSWEASTDADKQLKTWLDPARNKHRTHLQRSRSLQCNPLHSSKQHKGKRKSEENRSHSSALSRDRSGIRKQFIEHERVCRGL